MTNTAKTSRAGKREFTVSNAEKGEIRISITGRERWALEQLMAAGEAGCTPIDNPAPRWSHYVWLLRRDGVDVETITEAHGGPFKGTHARYVLRSLVEPAPQDTAQSIPPLLPILGRIITQVLARQRQ